MQPFAQETIKIRKNRREEKRSSNLPPPPHNYFCTFLAQVHRVLLWVCQASWLGSCPGWSTLLQLKSASGCSVASRSLERDVVPKSLCQGCPQHHPFGPWAWDRTTVTAHPIPLPQSSVPPNCLWSERFLPLSGWENVIFLAQTLDQPIQLHPNYLCGNRMLCQKCYSVYLSILPNRSHLYNEEIQYFLQHRKAAAQESDWSRETLLFHRHWK